MIHSAQSKTERIFALDFTKGILVLFMVVYHSLNYTEFLRMGFRWFSFLPPSFILITGFLIGQVYQPKYKQQKSKIIWRLVVRGLKLILMFTALNLAMSLLLTANYNGHELGPELFLGGWYSIYVTGGEHLASFIVLLPIGYVLLFSPLLLAANSFNRHVPVFILMVLLLLSLYLEMSGSSATNLVLFTAGVIGMIAGRVPRTSLDRIASWLPYLSVICIIYATMAFLAAHYFLIQFFGASVCLLLIFALGVRAGDDSRWQRKTVLLGEYSLFAYIAQLAILQLLIRISPSLRHGLSGLIILFVVTLISTYLLVELVVLLRKHFRVAEFYYKLVFA